METKMSDKELIEALQGYWMSVGNVPDFEIKGHKAFINGENDGIGIPGFDNTSGCPVTLKWLPEHEKWQIFINDLGWVLTVIDEIGEDYFIVSHFDTASQTFGNAMAVKRSVAEPTGGLE